jgi:hypothetical protein
VLPSLPLIFSCIFPPFLQFGHPLIFSISPSTSGFPSAAVAFSGLSAPIGNSNPHRQPPHQALT